MKILPLLFVLALAFVKPAAATDIPEEVVAWANDNVWLVETPQGTGSGFWIDDDYFVTACHNVRSSDEIGIYHYTDTTYIAMKKLTCNEANDIAILEARWENPLPPGRGAAVFHVRVGKTVYGAGYPLGGTMMFTLGHWIGEERVASWEDYPERVYLVTTPTINGDSGSPVIAMIDGEIVVAGLRRQIRLKAEYVGFAAVPIPMTHITLVASPESIQQELAAL